MYLNNSGIICSLNGEEIHPKLKEMKNVFDAVVSDKSISVLFNDKTNINYTTNYEPFHFVNTVKQIAKHGPLCTYTINDYLLIPTNNIPLLLLKKDNYFLLSTHRKILNLPLDIVPASYTSNINNFCYYHNGKIYMEHLSSSDGYSFNAENVKCLIAAQIVSPSGNEHFSVMYSDGKSITICYVNEILKRTKIELPNVDQIGVIDNKIYIKSGSDVFEYTQNSLKKVVGDCFKILGCGARID